MKTAECKNCKVSKILAQDADTDDGSAATAAAEPSPATKDGEITQ